MDAGVNTFVRICVTLLYKAGAKKVKVKTFPYSIVNKDKYIM